MLSPPIRRLLALLGPERGRWTLVGGLMSASALGEVAAPYFTGRVTDRVAHEEEEPAAAVWPLVLVGLASALSELACDSSAALALSRARARLQRGAVSAVLRGAVPGAGGALGDTAGAVAARLTGDAEAAHAALADALVPALWAATRAAALLAAVAWLSPALGLLTALALPLLLLLPRAVARVQQRDRGVSPCPQELARRVRAAQAGTTAVALEALGAMGTVRAFGHEAGATERVRRHLAQGHRLEQREALAYAAGLWASGFPALALKLALLFLGGRLVAAGSVTRGELVTILMCQLNFTRAVEGVLLYVPILAKSVGSSETLLELLEQAKVGTPAGPPSPVPPRSCDTAQGAPGLCLKDVWMSYPGRSEPVLKGVSLSLRPGEALAVLAPPGGGKSSLAAAALGLRPLAAGTVLLNGTPLSPRSEPALREQVAGVLQSPSLLSRTLRANISLGWGHKEGTPVVAAARRVGVHSWAQHLLQGYDTEVGPRGLPLSGGQAQGVALARALLRNPQVLVLDEPTRALDPVTRCQVEQELLRGRGPGQGPAVLLVTSRVALAQLAPRVALLEGGRLRELGSAEELGSVPWGTPGDSRSVQLCAPPRGRCLRLPRPLGRGPAPGAGAAPARVSPRLQRPGPVRAGPLPLLPGLERPRLRHGRLRARLGRRPLPQVPWVSPRLASRTPTSLRITWGQPPVPPDGYRVTLVPLDDPVAMTTHELPSSAVAFSVTGLSPGRPFELLVQARRGPHLGAPGVLRLRTGTG
ncbi:antigen peptide transporter 1-like [Melospiza georgiana]|uniref:antigen peptide transporter 1-like n=1 Tax=Melospiza georgiana TaxID=44398 RepID=UPI0025AB81F7|nr:antigen peptide transporter 1-like [Melospiza georgiana]